ncbi:hypothetical protein BGX29_008568 [Mortierella sp. GBA35]|nr:hypothetical protein BGX29_008568 [Mortierella sp. GBA35]
MKLNSAILAIVATTTATVTPVQSQVSQNFTMCDNAAAYAMDVQRVSMSPKPLCTSTEFCISVTGNLTAPIILGASGQNCLIPVEPTTLKICPLFLLKKLRPL